MIRFRKFSQIPQLTKVNFSSISLHVLILILDSLNYLASKHLKMAIEKKLSKDPRGNNSAIVPTVSDDTMTLPTEHNNTSTINTSITGKLQLSDFQSLERPPRDNRGQQIPKVKYL